MKIINGFVLAVVLLICAGCGAGAAPTPTVLVPTGAPMQIATRRPTQTPRAVEVTTAPTVSTAPTETMENTAAPTATLEPLEFTPASVRSAVETPIGTSVEGRQIVAHEFGGGRSTILLVGGIHGGWEANTTTLMMELIDYFDANPADILPPVNIHIIPVMNPDGAAAGEELAGRFNANEVDLNRNWACGWQPDAV